MEDDERRPVHRMPKRQLVYPFIELQYPDHIRGRDTDEIVPPSMEDRLMYIEEKPAGLERPAK